MFNSGDHFPGKQHQKRIADYAKAEHIVRSRYDEAFGVSATIRALADTDYLRRLDRDEIDRIERSVQVICNLPRVIAVKFASMVTVGLEITAEKAQQAAIDGALDASQWELLSGRLAMRCVAYGNAPLSAYRDSDGVVRVTAWEPWCWFPETSVYDQSHATAHTFAWQVEVGDRVYLLQERHSSGLIERSAHEMRGSAEGQELIGRVDWASVVGADGPPETEQTNVNRPLVTVFSNPGVDETVYGDSDILGNDSLINELTSRLSQIAEILDKHADPKLTGPQSAMRKDPNTGKSGFDVTGSRFLGVEDRNDPEFRYLTWESQLETAMAELDKVARYLCVTMHMCPDLIGLGQTTAGVEATDTLRIRAYNTLTEIERKRPYFAAGCRDMADMIAQLSLGKGADSVAVSFGDPLPASATERAKEIQALRVAGTISLETAVRRQNPMWTVEEVSAEVERIGKENEPVNVMEPGFE